MLDVTDRRPPGRYASTATDQARYRIGRAVAELLAARSAERNALDYRDAVIREEYANGVDARDLVTILDEVGGRLSVQQVHRIVRPKDEPEK